MGEDRDENGPASLSARLRARGAKPHSRMSDLSHYMLEHYDEIRTLVTIERFAWPDIAALLADEEGLADDQGRPVSGNAAKLAYSRIGKLRRSGEPSRQAGAPRPAVPATGSGAPPEASLAAQSGPALQAEMPETAGDDATRAAGFGTAEIRSARPRETPFAPSSLRSAPNSTAAPLNDDEVERRVNDLAARQERGKIPPPEIL